MDIISEGVERINRFVKAINQITHDNLSHTEQAALARLLDDYHESAGDLESHRTADYCAYQGAVEFLWMAFKITHTQKMDLLDLLG